MRLPAKLFNDQNPAAIRNYLFTFGYLIIEDFFSQQQIIEFNAIWDKEFHELTKGFKDNVPTYLSVGNLIEKTNLKYFDPQAENSLIEVIDKLLGEDAIYLGSGGNEMQVPTPWHRDVYLQTPIYKMACYLNNIVGGGEGGELCVVPGSQHATDVYAEALSSCVGWPGGGGMSRAPTYFPLLQAGDGSTTLDDYPSENAIIKILPFQKLTVNPRDLVIFDQRLVHGSTIYTNGRPRRLLLINVAVNPERISSDSKMCSRGYRPTEALLELEKWVQIELNASDNLELYEHLKKRPDMYEILKPKTTLLDAMNNTSKKIVQIGELQERNKKFFTRNCTDKDAPVCF